MPTDPGSRARRAASNPAEFAPEPEMAFAYWFPPCSADGWEIAAPENDRSLETELYSRTMLILRSSRHVELLCEDASQLTAQAFNAFLHPKLKPLCDLVVAIRFRYFTAATAQTLVPLVSNVPHLVSLELLKGFTIDRECVDVLSRLPRLTELAIDGFASCENSPWRELIEHLPRLTSLRRLAVPRCFLLEHEIDTLIEKCNLEELAVANAYEEDDQKAIQDKHHSCRIDWGYML